MCIGIPMQVRSVDQNRAYCVRYSLNSVESQPELVDVSLVGKLNPGDWVLVFINAAREIISQDRARQVGDALKALEAVNSGDLTQLDGLFADLDREPQLPAHLLNQTHQSSTKEN